MRHLQRNPTDERLDSLEDLAYEANLGRPNRSEWYGIYTRNGLTLRGNRSGNGRALHVDMGHSDVTAFTTARMGGGSVLTGMADRVSRPTLPLAGSATWRGLMIGATLEDDPDLLTGDVAVRYKFEADPERYTRADTVAVEIHNIQRIGPNVSGTAGRPGLPIRDAPIASWSAGNISDAMRRAAVCFRG